MKMHILGGPSNRSVPTTMRGGQVWTVRVLTDGVTELDRIAVEISTALDEAQPRPGYARCCAVNLEPSCELVPDAGEPGDIVCGPMVGSCPANWEVPDYRVWYVRPVYWGWKSRSGASRLQTVGVDGETIALQGNVSAAGLFTLAEICRVDAKLPAGYDGRGWPPLDWGPVWHPDGPELAAWLAARGEE